VGEMAAGLLLGPSLLGRVFPAAMNSLFSADGLGPLYALSQVGLVLFMFLMGLEVRPGAIRGSARSVAVASQASILAPFVAGSILAFHLYPRLGNGAARLPFVLFLGTAMGITAFPVLARILAERKLINTRVGLFAISCAAADDLSAWCVLAAITVIARPGAQEIGLPVRFAALVAYVLVMVFVIRPVARRLFPPNEPPALGRFSAVMILLLASVWTTEALGVHALFGAVPGRPGAAQRRAARSRAERAPRIDDAEPLAAAVLRLHRFAHEPWFAEQHPALAAVWLDCGCRRSQQAGSQRRLCPG